MTTELLGALQTAVAVALTFITAEFVKWQKTRKSRADINISLTKMVSGIAENKQAIHSIKGDIEAIRKEVTFNGGSSLKDEVYRISGETDAFLAIKMNSDNEAVYICDRDGFCTFANDKLCELFGMNYHEMLGNGWLAAVGKNQYEKDRCYTEWRQSVEKSIPYSTEYTLINQKTHEEANCRTHAIAIYSRKGEILFYKGVVAEIH